MSWEHRLGGDVDELNLQLTGWTFSVLYNGKRADVYVKHTADGFGATEKFGRRVYYGRTPEEAATRVVTALYQLDEGDDDERTTGLRDGSVLYGRGGTSDVQVSYHARL